MLMLMLILIRYREIKKEIDDIVMRQNHYRPGHVRAVATDAEKDRLNQIFTHHGGTTLPHTCCKTNTEHM